VAWLLAAVGAEQVVSWLPARAWIGGASVVFCLIPAWLFATNFKLSDRSRDTRAAIELDRLFQALPDRASIVSEDFIADRMVTAKLLGDDAAHGRHIELADPDSNLLRERLRAGEAVFAFRKSAQTLRFDGLDVGFQPLRLIEGPLDGFLSRLPDGAIVAIGVPAAQGGAFIATSGTSLETIGGPSDLVVLAGLNLAVVGVRGRTGAAIQAVRFVTTLDAAAGKQVGETGRASLADIHVHVEPFEASIRQGDRELVRSTEGIVMAVWSADGHLDDTFVLEAADRFQVPIRRGPLSAYKLRGTWTRERIAADSWTDVTSSLRSGSVMVRVASGEKLVLYLGDDAPMAPRVYDSSGRARVDVSSGSTLASGVLSGDLPGDVAAAFYHDGHVYRIEIDAFGATVSVHLALGGIPVHALGRVTRAATARAADAFRVDVGGLLKSTDRRSEILQMGRDAQSQLIGHGWSAVDRDDRGPFRWMIATDARVILPLSRSSVRRLRVQALREARTPDTTMRLRVNGMELAPQPLQPGWHVYEWVVPAGCVVSGINEASVVVERLADLATGKAGGKGIAVSDVRVIHD
jgi:hypothetical protein